MPPPHRKHPKCIHFLYSLYSLDVWHCDIVTLRHCDIVTGRGECRVVSNKLAALTSQTAWTEPMNHTPGNLWHCKHIEKLQTVARRWRSVVPGSATLAWKLTGVGVKIFYCWICLPDPSILQNSFWATSLQVLIVEQWSFFIPFLIKKINNFSARNVHIQNTYKDAPRAVTKPITIQRLKNFKSPSGGTDFVGFRPDWRARMRPWFSGFSTYTFHSVPAYLPFCPTARPSVNKLYTYFRNSSGLIVNVSMAL